jgi:hypothetical protein
MTGVPLRDGKDALAVNWLEIEIVDAAGAATYRNSFVTDLPVNRKTVASLATGGRARWKIENGSFNVLKTQGYNLEHNFGHGKQNLAAMLVALNLLAFAFHTVCDLAEDAWRAARSKAGSRTRFFTRMAAISEYLVFASWEVRWTPETGQVAKRESSLGTAGWPKVRYDQYTEETRA